LPRGVRQQFIVEDALRSGRNFKIERIHGPGHVLGLLAKREGGLACGTAGLLGRFGRQ
jgi:hypothetical protein